MEDITNIVKWKKQNAWEQPTVNSQQPNSEQNPKYKQYKQFSYDKVLCMFGTVSEVQPIVSWQQWLMCLRHNYSDCCLATEPVLEPCPKARPPDPSSACKHTFYLAVRTLQYANFWAGKGTETGAGGHWRKALRLLRRSVRCFSCRKLWFPIILERCNVESLSYRNFHHCVRRCSQLVLWRMEVQIHLFLSSKLHGRKWTAKHIQGKVIGKQTVWAFWRRCYLLRVEPRAVQTLV